MDIEPSKIEYNQVRLMTPKYDANGNTILDSYQRILIPVNISNTHWCLAEIQTNVSNDHIKGFQNAPLVAFYLYDSSKSPSNDAVDEPILKILQEYCRREIMAKVKGGSQENYLRNINAAKFIVKDVPQQTNFSDCGVFTCFFVKCITANNEKFPTPPQNNMDKIRTEIKDVIQGNIKNPLKFWN